MPTKEALEYSESVIANAKRNIRVYPLVKIFNKRVFLATIPIFYVDYVGFSLEDVGLLAGMYAIVNMIANVPAGYLADRFGKANMIRIAAVLQIIATLLYGLVATKTSIIVGLVLESLAFAVLSGAGEALAHDSLEVQRKTPDYSKILSRSQSIALLINAFLVTTAALTYAIDPRMPFLVGTLAFMMLLVAGIIMKDVLPATQRNKKKFNYSQLQILWRYKALVTFAFVFGIIGAIYFSFEIMPIAMQSFGMDPSHTGLVYSAASIFGAAIGLSMHRLKLVPIKFYMAIDIVVLSLPFIAGYLSSLWLLVAAIVVNMTFWRYRSIIYQHHIFDHYDVRYKATVISTMQFTEALHRLWVPFVVMVLVARHGIASSFGMIVMSIFGIGVIFVGFGVMAFAHKKSSE